MRPPGNRSGALNPSRTVGDLSSHMDPGYDEVDWEVEIRRRQEDANTEVSQNRSLWFQLLRATQGLLWNLWIVCVGIWLLRSSQLTRMHSRAICLI
jgi:hypothetical protein